MLVGLGLESSQPLCTAVVLLACVDTRQRAETAEGRAKVTEEAQQKFEASRCSCPLRLVACTQCFRTANQLVVFRFATSKAS